MDALVYDGSFEGLLTAIFEVYEYRMHEAIIYRETNLSPSLFSETHVVQTQPEKAARVHHALKQKLSPVALRQFYKTYLSELPQIESQLLAYVQYVLLAKYSVENDYSHSSVQMLQQTSRKVDREKHRMEAFVRFQLTKDELYYSIVQPDYNVLPLVSKHFQDRYADQRWLIYDVRRKYGLYYDLCNVAAVQIDFSINKKDTGQLATIHDEKEALYQQLWQQYFASVNIVARKNMKLHIQHMPKRYWPYLVEKRPGQEHF